MRFERLIIESGDNSISFDLHPRLTVISGLGKMERDGLINEFVGALGASRPGVHLEFVSGDGGRYAVFRPDGASHRVIDVGNRVDATAQFIDSRGRIDLLSRVGLDSHSAKRVMRFTAQDLAESAERDSLIQELARVDQAELWAAAEQLETAQRHLEDEADAAGTNVEDAAVIERVERHHAEFERSQDQSERIRKLTFLVAGLSALLSVPAVKFVDAAAALPLGAVALLAVAVSLVFHFRMMSAQKAEEAALAEAGAESYLGFHLQRVNQLLSSDSGRRRLITAAEDHRAAIQRWSAVAGEIEVGWAVANRLEIGAAVKLRENMAPMTHGLADESQVDHTAALAHAVTGRLRKLCNVGGSTETFPALLDEPFSNVDSGTLPPLLEILTRTSERQQIVLLTDSPTVESWARVEAMTGAIGIIEPTPTATRIKVL